MIGFIGEIKSKDNEEMKGSDLQGDEASVSNLYFMLKAEQPLSWYKYIFGKGEPPKVETITCETDSSELTTDPSITFALYRKELTQTIIAGKKGTFTSAANQA